MRISEASLNAEIPPGGLENMHVKSLCLVMDEDIVNGLERIRDTLGFPIESMIAQSIRPFVNAFLPIAGLQEQGKLSIACMADLQHSVESLMVKIDVAKTRFDKNCRKLDMQNRTGLPDKR